MPNNYYYFESSEISYERLILEIQLLKQLKEKNFLQNLQWNAYDTPALKLFLQEGIDEVKYELSQRFRNHSKKSEYDDFIKYSIENYRSSSYLSQQTFSFPFIVNIIFISICLFSIIGLFIYQYNYEDNSFNILKHPLTTKQRQLSFLDDLSIILLTFTTIMILALIILARRLNKKLILFGIILLAIIIIYLIIKYYLIIRFLSTYRELRWPMVCDYIYF